MTIKEAFGMLFKAVKKSGMNPFFLIGNLKDAFEDVAENIDGTDVEVEPLYTEGIPIADISVDGDTTRIFTPQITTFDNYYQGNLWSGDWYMEGPPAKAIYKMNVIFPTISKDYQNPTQIELPIDRRIISLHVTGTYTIDGTSYVFSGTSFVVSSTFSRNLNIYVQKTGNYYNCYYTGEGVLSDVIMTIKSLMPD